jgi:CheY-like chemotaxis protein
MSRNKGYELITMMKKKNNNNNDNKILLVDDEPNITSLFSIALEDCGFIVDLFNDPLLALETFKQKYKEKSSYALALLDVKMPNMNGFELFNQIRSKYLLLQHLIWKNMRMKI